MDAAIREELFVSHDLMQTILDKMQQLDESVLSLHPLGVARAEAERKYKMEYAKELLTQKANGTAIGIIEGVTKGQEKIANLKFDLDVAESRYDSCREYVLATKKEIEIFNDIISREWTHG